MTEPSKALTLQSINRGGIATLSDGGQWRIAPDHLSRATGWEAGDRLNLQANEPGKVYPKKLVNIETSEEVSVVQSGLLSDRVSFGKLGI